MEAHNLTRVSEFYLLGLSDDSDLQPVLFALFLSMYLVTVLGNLLIVLAVSADSRLHTPMYFFLSNLSFVDICLTSTTVPKMMVDTLAHSRVISYTGCLTQMSLFILFGCMDDMLLAVMAYDRFVAICHPLHHSVFMSRHLCLLLVSMSFLVSLLDSLLHNCIASQLTYFKDVEIANFFCDASQLFILACSPTLTSHLVRYSIVALSIFLPTSGIIFSYLKIGCAILRIPSSEGKYKAFSTCGSHLSVLCLFYGTGFGVYLGSLLSASPRHGAVASVVYTAVTPMLNPFIYSLRNEDVRSALRSLCSRSLQFHGL